MSVFIHSEEQFNNIAGALQARYYRRRFDEQINQWHVRKALDPDCHLTEAELLDEIPKAIARWKAANVAAYNNRYRAESCTDNGIFPKIVTCDWSDAELYKAIQSVRYNSDEAEEDQTHERAIREMDSLLCLIARNFIEAASAYKEADTWD